MRVYIGPQYRIGPYLVGIFLGYVLSGQQNQKDEKPKSLKIIFGWLIAALLALTSLFGLYPALQVNF